MIRTGTGNILEADAEALVNTVNCVGVMGKGIALQFRKAWPAMFTAYQKAAKADEVVPGRMHVYPLGALVGPRFIINFPTKRHWRARSRLDDIEAGLDDLVRVIRDRQIKSIAVPPLGAGLGGLPWAEVKARIVAALAPLDDVDVQLWEPGTAPRAEARPARTERPQMTPARAAVLALMDQYPVLDHDVSHIEVQKLAYFLQAAGADLDLRFAQHHYGPYADRLYHLLQRLEGHHISGLVDRQPNAPLRVHAEAAAEARAFLAGDPMMRTLFERVRSLIEGFETPRGMELLATVHWVATDAPQIAADVDACIAASRDWSPRKREHLRVDHLRIAWQRLMDEGWLPPRRASAA